MKRLVAAVTAAALCAAPVWAAKRKPAVKHRAKAAAGPWKKTPGLYARFHTNRGGFVCRLFEKEAPETVSRFVGLAAGEKEYTDPRDGEKKKGRFYDGLTFHRVVPNYIIQGGDPKGDSTGGPGWQFADEINGLKFDRPGRLAMANAGPDGNGSQFFVTVGPAEALDDKTDAAGKVTTHYTIFGQVVEGQQVVEAISRVKAEAEKPLEPVVLKTLEILRVDKKGRMTPEKRHSPPQPSPHE